MIVVKITAFLLVVLVVCGAIIKFHFSNDIGAACKMLMKIRNDEIPAWLWAFTTGIAVEAILIIVSAFWFLFLR